MSAPQLHGSGPHGEKGPAEPTALHRKINNHSGHHEEGEEGEPWLLSYADMVTLLMCFFVIFFSMDKSHGAINDPSRIKQRLEELIGIDARVLTPPPAGGKGAKAPGTAAVKAGLEKDLEPAGKDMKVVFSLSTPKENVVEITFLTANFFASASADLTPEAEAALRKVTPRVAKLGEAAQVEVEGHTDSDPMVSGAFPSNWELSAARAGAVARLLQAEGVKPEHLKVAGLGEYHPLVRELDARGIADITAKRLNRRVVIRLILPAAAASAQKLK